MKPLPILASVLYLASCNSGCAYFYNRWRDAGDIFTASAGAGYGGVKARAGPLQLALFQNHDVLGLRGGRFFFNTDQNKATDTASPFADLYHGAYQVDCFYLDYPGHDPRGKDYGAYGPFLVLFPAEGVPENYSQIEVAMGLGGTLRLGFNPGELVDFLLGWTTLDIYGDDIGLPDPEPSPTPIT